MRRIISFRRALMDYMFELQFLLNYSTGVITNPAVNRRYIIL